MRITLTSSLILIAACAFGQVPDLTGKWLGNSTFLKNNFRMEYDITQQGSTVTAIVLSVGKKDSVKERLEGGIKGNKLELNAEELI